jgi:hypothetical protein
MGRVLTRLVSLCSPDFRYPRVSRTEVESPWHGENGGLAVAGHEESELDERSERRSQTNGSDD